MKCITRLVFSAFGLAFVLGLTPVSTSSAQAQSVSRIRYFVAPNPSNFTELFEVIDGAPGGGRLIRDGRWEFIPGPTGGVSDGYTDRASRGNAIVTQVLGSGVVTLQVRAGSQVLVSLPTVSLPTPGIRNMVSSNPLQDNISVAALRGNTILAQRRLPIGTRP